MFLLSVVFYQVLHFLHEYNLVVGIMIQRVFLLPSGKCDSKPPNKSFICMLVCHKYFCWWYDLLQHLGLQRLLCRLKILGTWCKKSSTISLALDALQKDFVFVSSRASPAVLSMWPCKIIFHIPSLVIYFSATPPIKLKLGQQIILIATHLDQSLWWANQKYPSVVRLYLLHSFL